MQFTIVAVAAFAAAVSALPQINGKLGATNSGVESCAANHKTSCCDVSNASDGLLSNILGGSCSLSNFNIPVIAGGVSGPQCNNGNTFCCPTTQDGNLNPSGSCIPITL
jgi:hypothetical protein